nr:hypothetical protein [Tanacetum cinerariifolium]
MDTTIDQQVARDEALVPHAKRLRIGRSNFHMLSDIKSKESTLQLVYDVLRLTPFFKAFLVTADVPEIYMQEFWAKATVEHKDTKKRNEMYYPRFAKVIIQHFMSKDPSILGRNKDTQQFDALLPIELTNEDIRNSNAYKEYYAVATEVTPPEPKASVRKTKSSFDTTITPPTAVAGPRLTISEKGKQAAKASKAKNEGTGSILRIPDLPTDESEEEIYWNSTDEEGDGDGDDEDDDGKEGNNDDDQEDEGDDGEDDKEDEGGDDEQASDEEEFIHPSLSTHTKEETRDEESFDPILKTPENSDDEGNEENFSEFMQTNQFAKAVSAIPGIAQEENDEFLKTIDENMHKIIKEQRNLYKTIVEAYESDKIILDTYKETVMLKRRRDDDADKDEEPSTGSDRGSKRCREGKEPKSASAPQETATRSAGKSTQGSGSRQTSTSQSPTTKEPMQTTFDMEKPAHPEFETGADDQPIIESSQHPEWFSQQQKPPTLDHAWNKTLPATHGSIQPWISELAKQSDSRFSFNELMDTQVDFSNFLINRLKVDTLTSELLAGPTYELLKGSCKSIVEIEYHLEEVYKATTDLLDWVNPEGQQYPHNLLKPLPLIPNNRGYRVIPFDHFINNDLEYLRGGASSRKYTNTITKTKATNYGHIKGIEDLEFVRDVYSKCRIIAVTELKIVEWHNYKHLDWITIRRDDDKLYKFKEGDFKRLRIQDIKDMLLLLVQGKLNNVTVKERYAFKKKLNLTKPDTFHSDLKRKEAYIAYSNPRGFIYQNKDKQNWLMRIDKLHKFSDGRLTDIRTALDDRL